jgi:hypothetical protein
MHLKPTAECQISTLIFEKKNVEARTLPSLIYFSWDIYRDPTSTIFFQISELIFDTLLWASGALSLLGT